MPFISSFTVLRHDLRRIRMRNDGIARASLTRLFLPSFLSLRFPSRECISPVIFSSTVARCRERMLERTPLTRLRRKSSCRVASQLLRALLRCGRSVAIRYDESHKRDRYPWNPHSDALIVKRKYPVKNLQDAQKLQIIFAHRFFLSSPFQVSLFSTQFYRDLCQINTHAVNMSSLSNLSHESYT